MALKKWRTVVEKERKMTVTYKVPMATVKGLVMDYVERQDNVALENLEVEVVVLEDYTILEATYPPDLLVETLKE